MTTFCTSRLSLHAPRLETPEGGIMDVMALVTSRANRERARMRRIQEGYYYRCRLLCIYTQLGGVVLQLRTDVFWSWDSPSNYIHTVKLCSMLHTVTLPAIWPTAGDPQSLRLLFQSFGLRLFNMQRPEGSGGVLFLNHRAAGLPPPLSVSLFVFLVLLLGRSGADFEHISEVSETSLGGITFEKREAVERSRLDGIRKKGGKRCSNSGRLTSY